MLDYAHFSFSDGAEHGAAVQNKWIAIQIGNGVIPRNPTNTSGNQSKKI
jgi:hypothetical protein